MPQISPMSWLVIMFIWSFSFLMVFSLIKNILFKTSNYNKNLKLISTKWNW